MKSKALSENWMPAKTGNIRAGDGRCYIAGCRRGRRAKPCLNIKSLIVTPVLEKGIGQLIKKHETSCCAECSYPEE